MNRYPVFAFFLLALQPWTALPAAFGPDSGVGRGVTAASPCDSVSDSPFSGDEVIIYNVSVDGGGNTAVVATNDSFTVAFDYHIQVCPSGELTNFCQVVVGYASSPQPQFCVFRQRVDCDGVNGSLSFRLKAPAFPSEYLVAFEMQRTLAEPGCPSDWPEGPPVPDRYLACVNVTAGNIPVPATGGVDNVTGSSATLHGMVNPAGAPTTVRFLLGTAPGVYTDSVGAAENPVTGTTALPVSAPVSGLAGNTRYYYRATAESENGYNVAGEEDFFTGGVFSPQAAGLAFGHLPPNGSRTDTVTVRNEGDAVLQVSSVIPLTGQYSVAPQAVLIQGRGERKFAVTFSPPAYGDFSSGIVFIHSGTGSPDTVAVHGDAPVGGVLAGWNIVSLPLIVADPRKTVVFPDALSGAYEFSAGYAVRDTLTEGKGYWVKFPAADSMVVTGDLRENLSVPVGAGWNMIGGPSLPVPLDSVFSTPPGIVAGNFFEYAAGYSPVGLIRPGKGYWVKVSGPGTLSMRGLQPGGAAPRSEPAPVEGRALSITDASGRSMRLYVSDGGAVRADPGLPPPPPGGAFDARFGGDRMVVSAAGGESGDVPIRLGGAMYPVAISWEEAIAGCSLLLDGAAVPLGAPGSLTLREGQSVAFRASGGGEEAGRSPSTGGLTGNYPNPFNPTTTLAFDLAEPGEVRLSAFNALGEEVSVLASGPMTEGTHVVTFDGSGLPGGVYFARLVTRAGTSTLRMLLVK